MEQQQAIGFSPIGIVRSTPDTNSPDGACQEIVNMRLRDGAWRALTPKVVKKDNMDIFDHASNFYVHQVREDNYVVALDETDNTVYVYNVFTTAVVQTLMIIPTEEQLKEIKGFSKYLIITTDVNKYVFNYDYDDDTYVLLPKVPEGKIWFESFTAEEPVNIDLGGDLGSWENAIGALRKLRFDDGQKGYFEGHAYFRTAWQLFDGSYILHSPVHYCRVGLNKDATVFFRNSIFYLGGLGHFAGAYGKYNPLMWHIFSSDQKADLTKYKNIIRSLVVFMSKPISQRDVAAEFPSSWTIDGSTIYPNPNSSVAMSFENMNAFYKAVEIPLDDIVTNNIVNSNLLVENIESLETREHLPIDSFTNHTIFGLFSKDYNSRLHMGNVTTKLLDSYNNGRYASDEATIINDIIFEGYTKSDFNLISYVPWDIHFEVELETDKGERLTRRTPPVDLTNLSGCTLFTKTVGDDLLLRLVMKEVITYPDTRAKRINVCVTADGEYRKLASYDMKSHPVFNLSYFVGTLNSADDVGDPNGYFEPNVIQISEAIVTNDDAVVADLQADQSTVKTPALVALEDAVDEGDHFDDTVGVHKYIAFADGAYQFEFNFGVDTMSEPAECRYHVSWHKNGTKVKETDYGLKFPFEATETYSATLDNLDEITIKVWVSEDPVNPVLLLAGAKFSCFIYPTSGSITIPGTLFEPKREVNDLITDPNRLQVSELNNLFLYPAKNSYRIGTMQNVLTALATMSEPMSQGQFGQFPLHVFTKEGIFNLNQSQTPDVLYVNTLPLNMDVIMGGTDGLVELGGAVVYATANGLFILSGTQVKEIGQVMEGSLTIPVSGISHYQNVIKYNYTSMISDLSFLTVLSGVNMAYDHVNRELLLAVRSSNYTYVYSFDNNHWTKVGVGYAAFYRGSEGLYGLEISRERVVVVHSENTVTANGLIHFFVSRPMKLGSNGLKKIERMILRGYQKVPTGKTSALYVFASPDGVQWKMIRGVNPTAGENTDIVVKRLHVSFRYIIVVYASPVLAASIDTYPLTLTNLISQLQGFDVQLEQSYSGKLR